MRVSIITIVYNNEKFIGDTIRSVIKQNYPDIEYIIVDGLSTDGTMDIINGFKDKINITISEKDFGLYDAINKGIMVASGDIIGILNSDDIFYDDFVISKVVNAFINNEIDATIGDVLFIRNKNNKVIRYYSSEKWKPSKFTRGFMPPHPSFFVKKSIFNKLGYYKLHYKIAADYELLIRFLFVNKIKWKYISIITTKMRIGGKSTKNLNSIITLNKEILLACKENGLKTNYLKIYSKYLLKPFEFIFR